MGHARHGSLVARLAVAFVLVLLALRGSVARAEPLDPRAVPEPLRPWTAWALDGAEAARCATLWGRDQARCDWPSRVVLDLDEHSGAFEAAERLDDDGWLPLPGDGKRWPVDVLVDGRPAPVAAHDDRPGATAARGEHTVSGRFLWNALPESLQIPTATALLSLRVRGADVAAPNRDASGVVWLQKAAASEEGEALEILVTRKVTDGVPVLLETDIDLHVAGKSREELLGRALPDGFVPMSLDSPLPVRIEGTGHLRVGLRPGVFSLHLTARSTGPTASVSRPAPGGPWREGDEVWVFEAKNEYRVVTLSGGVSIDPQQTTLPNPWKRFPAYAMKVGSTLSLVEKRRGDADLSPDQLSLDRTLWLDFAGTGYTVSDQIRGSVHQASRLTMSPPSTLGRVSIGGADQFITHLGDDPRRGVEVRPGNLEASADSRIEGDPSDIPAVGWAQDFHEVKGTLHLPPGWRLLHASGVDDMPATWVRGWSLLELFLVLLVAIGVGRLYGMRWGAVALAMLVLTLTEENAPKWCWLPLLAAEALFRVLPAGQAKRLLNGARLLAIASVAMIALPFLVEHVRQGIHPALAAPATITSTDGVPPPVAELDSDPAARKKEAPDEGDEDKASAESPAPASPKAAASGAVSSLGGKRAAPASPAAARPFAYDPGVIVQTGPGLPRWQWAALALHWSGPVAASQRLHLYLLSPTENLLLSLLRAALLVAVIARVSPWSARFLSRGGAFAAAAVALWLLPAPAHADLPSRELLQELHDRLLRKPDCGTKCASSGRMSLEVRGNVLRARIEVDALVATAVPLPGGAAQWTPAQVLVDGQPAAALARLEDGTLFVALAEGRHQIAIEGPLPARESVELALPLKPHHVEATAVGWSISGLHEDGLADDDLELTRVRAAAASPEIERTALPPFVRVERTLSFGVKWQAETRIVRLSPVGAAVILEVPILPGESITTADVRVEAGKALVDLAPQASEATWRSVIEPRSPVRLVAPRSVAWVEVWRLDVSPLWHASYTGIPFVQPHGAAPSANGGLGQTPRALPEWHPWPGEEAGVALVRPEGVPGQTLTVDESRVDIRPGLRATEVTLEMTARSSRGGEHTLTLPADAQLESVRLNGATLATHQDGRHVTLPVAPGSARIELVWREPAAIATHFSSSPIDLGAPSVNATTTLAVPGDRWLLLVGGPRVGPAVLFWSLLLVLLVTAIALGQNRWTPLRWWHWLLLGVGLSQVSVVAGAAFVGWLLALGWRGQAAEVREEDRGQRIWFNLRQVALVAWTLVALGVLAVSLYQGLLGTPEMQVRGNGSDARVLRWFVDRSESTLPQVWLVSVPLFVYRAAMLGWALWIALGLLGWLRWGWAAMSRGGLWMKRPPPPPPAVSEPAPGVSGAPT